MVYTQRKKGSDEMKRLKFGFKFCIMAVLVLGLGVALHMLSTEIAPDLAALPDADENFTPEESEPPLLGDMGYLVLVNHDHPAPAYPDLSLIVRAWPTVPVSSIYDVYLHETALSAVAEMFDSARAAGIYGLFVSSGFRDFEHQYRLYDGGANGEFVMPPGHSEHHTGLAADILAAGISMHEFGTTPQGRWLAENSHRYGLILRYPQGKQYLTGIGYEPWHFRYIGREHASFMFENNLVLEEYIELLRGEYGIYDFNLR
jgi:D-alanyl-D-alanine carboxypeptidase